MTEFFNENKGTLLMIGGAAVCLGVGYYIGKKQGVKKADDALKSYLAIAQDTTKTAAEKSAAAAAMFNTAMSK